MAAGQDDRRRGARGWGTGGRVWRVGGWELREVAFKATQKYVHKDALDMVNFYLIMSAEISIERNKVKVHHVQSILVDIFLSCLESHLPGHPWQVIFHGYYPTLWVTLHTSLQSLTAETPAQKL